MGTLRKANAYTKKYTVAFTRTSRRKNKSFIKVVPPQKIVKFTMGKYDPVKLPHMLTLISDQKVQLRHNALESCRQYINRKMDDVYPGQYYFRVVPFPHHIQRENKMLTGAGADRMQTGMQLSFGRSTGKAALIKRNAQLFVVAVPNEKAVKYVREIFQQIKSKLPCTSKVLYEFKKVEAPKVA